MFERFTERARQVVVLAQEEARALKHNYIGTEHLLLGLLREEEGVAARVLDGLEVSVEEVRAAVVRIVGSGEESPQGQIPFTPRAKKVLELALREALSPGPQLHRHRAHPARPRARGRGRRRAHPARPGRRAREDPQRGHAHAQRPRPPRRSRQRRRSEGKRAAKVLDQFGRNLTKLAEEGKLDPCIGRARPRSSASCRSSAGAPRTTPCSSASRASARRPSSRASPSASPTTRCPSCSRASRSARSTSPRSSPAPSTAASSRSASRRS